MKNKKQDAEIDSTEEVGIPKDHFYIKSPLKDHPVFMPPLVDPPIHIKKGVPVSVPNFLKQTMITEKVIKE